MAEHGSAFIRVKKLVTHAVALAHPKQDYKMYLFTDASDLYSRIFLTQVPNKQLKVSVHDQEHKPLVFLSG
jgi:hypothetical protein